MDNLRAPDGSEAKGIVQLPIGHEAKARAIPELTRMNISSATLFPDLGGFAESLADWFYLRLRVEDKDLRMEWRDPETP